ncbi:lysozyme inhibitor LprI family protein [Pseudomonas syringae]|uniref:lysozyme inhibitor LprI family protein n=1 Tax=Pseudomonas syringae TaxID=317 RepID=UPI003F777BAE
MRILEYRFGFSKIAYESKSGAVLHRWIEFVFGDIGLLISRTSRRCQMVSLALSNALFAGLCILSLTGAAFADSDCNVNEISNPDIITCTQASYANLDKVWNAQYKSLLSELDSPSKSELLSTQKAWVTLKRSIVTT